MLVRKCAPKVFPKSSKMIPESFQNRRLGRVLGALGASWGCLGASWGVFGCLGGVLGRLVAVLGASWGVLARKRWPTWLQLGPQNGARIEKKSKQKSIKILMPLGVGFLKDFSGFGRVKWSQVGTKIDPKSMSASKSVVLKKLRFTLRKTIRWGGEGGPSHTLCRT